MRLINYIHGKQPRRIRLKVRRLHEPADTRNKSWIELIHIHNFRISKLTDDNFVSVSLQRNHPNYNYDIYFKTNNDKRL